MNPYLAYATLEKMLAEGYLNSALDKKKAIKNFNKAVSKGLLKIMSKMGISTQQSYRGAQIFESVGLSSAVNNEFFTGTPSRIEGIGLDEIAAESAQAT